MTYQTIAGRTKLPLEYSQPKAALQRLELLGACSSVPDPAEGCQELCSKIPGSLRSSYGSLQQRGPCPARPCPVLQKAAGWEAAGVCVCRAAGPVGSFGRAGGAEGQEGPWEEAVALP